MLLATGCLHGTTGQKDARVAVGGWVGVVGARTLGSLNKGFLWQMPGNPMYVARVSKAWIVSASIRAILVGLNYARRI